MLRLFAARENTDKERFIYDNVSGETLVLVPDQYTLVAEQQALKYLGSRCLFDVEILSMNRLGLRMLSEQGQESVRMLDRYGRFMLLNRIIKEHRGELSTFANSAGKLTFTNMVSDFISDFKQQNCSPEEIRSMLESDDADDLLRNKMTELESLIEAYEKAIEGRYTDSEDYIALYVDAIGKSATLAGKKVWIYGYDSITPKFMNAMFELAAACEEVNFVVNESDFGLDESLVGMLRCEGELRGIEVVKTHVPDSYVTEKSETIKRIERGLFNDELPEAERRSNMDFGPEDLTLIRAANPYYEAENAAVYIYHLIRDLGYRMNEIQVIANDEAVMQPIIRRTFEEYGLPVFLDKSRNITDAAPVGFIVSLLRYIRYGDRTEAIMSLLKTELTSVDRGDVEELENYARTYHVVGSMWQKPFKYGADKYGARFDDLNEIRAGVAASLGMLDDMAKDTTVAEFVEGFRSYLEDEWQLSVNVEKSADLQEEAGLHDDAQRSVESYRAALDLLDQMVEIMGDDELDINEFVDIYMTGLINVEIGVIPPTADGLAMGTMIRTRPGAARAVVILGSNEGVLPLQPATEGLFSVDEKAYFRNRGFALGHIDDIRITEENVAMYRILSRPSEKLYISWSMTDIEGNTAMPSSLIDSLTDLFPRIVTDDLIEKDVISRGWSSELVNSSDQAMRHLFNHIKDRNTPSDMDALTESMMSWYEKNRDGNYPGMLEAVQDENDPGAIGSEISHGLYAERDGSYRLSASSIDGYFRCPFKFFVDRGLRPEEERDFSSDPRYVGDIYHQCLMTVAERIMKDRPWGEVLAECSDGQLLDTVTGVLTEIAGESFDGLFQSDEKEKYRLDRIREICSAAVRALAIQLTKGNVTDADFEEKFGRGRKFRPLEFDVCGEKFYVEGTIDRADIIDGDRVRIIDYKTGLDKLDMWKMSHGYKMQLMIYMMSADESYEPAGLFYFNIADPIECYNKVDEKKAGADGTSKKDKPLSERFKLNGEYINEEGILESMPPEVLGKGNKGISMDEFRELRSDVEGNIKEIAKGIATGNIDIRPLKEDNRLVCGLCDYKAICRRDRNYGRNAGREIPSKPKKEKNS